MPADLRIAWNRQGPVAVGAASRHFVGLHRQPRSRVIQGALVRVLGRGLAATADVVASGHSAAGAVDVASTEPVRASPRDDSPADVAEWAAEVAASLTARLAPIQGTALAIALHGFGHWQQDLVHDRCYMPDCDTARLSQLTGLTVVDDFPSRDLADQGRGGPCEAAGIWMLLGDRSTIPGRRIRALLDLGDTVRLFLLPPRQPGQLPPHLLAYDVAPGEQLLAELTRHLSEAQHPGDPQGKLAVQGRQVGRLLEGWLAAIAPSPIPWQPEGFSMEPWLQVLQAQLTGSRASLHDVLCTAVHFIARRIAQCLKEQLPRSQPVGQLILTGGGRRNGFLVQQIQQLLPELEFSALESWSIPAISLPAAATALLAQLHIDQVPANSPSLTGAQAPRILGRLTPGRPTNWHQVLADMALTLPAKLPLRNAV